MESKKYCYYKHHLLHPLDTQYRYMEYWFLGNKYFRVVDVYKSLEYNLNEEEFLQFKHFLSCRKVIEDGAYLTWKDGE